MFDINEVSSPGAAAAVVLERTDPTTLSDLDLVGYAQAAERQVAHATAMSLQASLVLAERAEARARGELAEGSGCQGIRPAHAEVLAERAGIAEVQQALRLSMNAAGSRLHRARALAGPLAPTGAALTSGVINFGHVLVLLDHTDGLPNALIERMQARCLPRAGVQTPGNFGKSLTRALHALDPQGSAQAHRTARTGAGVRVSQGRDGMSALIITATSPDAAWGYTIVDTLARAELHRRHRASTETDETAGNGVLRTPSDVSEPGQDGNGVLGTPSEACGIEDPAGNGVLRTPSDACGIEDPDRNGVLGAPGCPHRPPSLDQLRSQVFFDLLARAVHDPEFPTEHGKRRIETQLVLTLPTLLGLREDPATINGQSVPAPIARELAAATSTLPPWAPAREASRGVTDPVTGHLLDYGHTYHPPAALTEYLIARDQTCRVPHCNIRASAADLDHATPATERGRTSSANMGALSRGHHSAKTARLTDLIDSHPDGSATYITVLGQRIHIPPRPVLEPPEPLQAEPAAPPPTGGPPPF